MMKKIWITTMAILVSLSVVSAQVIDQQGPKPAKAVYTCPMHPEVTSDKAGKCPKCGMTLVQKKKGGASPGKGKKDSTSMNRMKM